MKERFKKWNFYSDRVEVRIEGFQIGKLLDAAAKNGILLRNVRMHAETEAQAEIASCDLKRLKKLGGARYRITTRKRQGGVYRVRRMRKRPMLPVGILLAAAIVIGESFFGAAIEVDGYRAIPESELRACLAESGVREGVYRPGIDWEKAEAAVFARFPQIMWVRLVYDGRLVLLEVAETGHKIIRGETELSAEEEDLFIPAPEDRDGYCDIVAARGGYIERIDPVWGDAMAEPGDYVKKGQVLIRGQIPIEPTTFEENAPKEYYVRAQGEVWARVPYRLTFRQERYLRSAQVAGEQTGQAEQDAEKAGEQGSEQGGRGAEDSAPGGAAVVADRVEKSQKQAKAKAEQQIRIWAKENLPENAEIVKKSLNFTQKENIIEVGVTLEVRQQIGKEQEIEFGTQNSDQQRD